MEQKSKEKTTYTNSHSCQCTSDTGEGFN